MNDDHYAAYIRRQLSRIQYDSKNASRNAHYQLGVLIGIVAQMADQDNKIMNLVQAKLERNPYRV